MIITLINNSRSTSAQNIYIFCIQKKTLPNNQWNGRNQVLFKPHGDKGFRNSHKNNARFYV